jgi:tetratricopeptide (TPR) repeat protein
MRCLMRSLTGLLCCVAVLSALGCGQNKARQAAEESAQQQAQYDRLLSQANKDLEEGRYDGAIKSAEDALKIREDAEVRELLAKAKEARQKAHEEAYEKALQSGRKAMEDKDYQAAADAFREALRQLPGDKEAQTLLQEAGFQVASD